MSNIGLFCGPNLLAGDGMAPDHEKIKFPTFLDDIRVILADETRRRDFQNDSKNSNLGQKWSKF